MREADEGPRAMRPTRAAHEAPVSKGCRTWESGGGLQWLRLVFHETSVGTSGLRWLPCPAAGHSARVGPWRWQLSPAAAAATQALHLMHCAQRPAGDVEAERAAVKHRRRRRLERRASSFEQRGSWRARPAEHHVVALLRHQWARPPAFPMLDAWHCVAAPTSFGSLSLRWWDRSMT